MASRRPSRARISRNDTPSLEEYQTDPYLGLILHGSGIVKHRLLIAVPSTGLVRMEWAMARWGQLIPTNWSAVDCVEFMQQVTPLGYNVADARNLAVDIALSQGFQWMFFIDSDVLLPPSAFMKMNAYVRDGTIPVVFGIYWTKSHPAEPLVYRGIGNSYFKDFTLGEKFWVSGIGMGCTLIDVRLLRVMADEAPYYMAAGMQKVKRVFDTPQVSWVDEEHQQAHGYTGTEDLAWCKRVTEGDYMRKAGFPKVGRRKWQFLCDSSILCRHITPDGVQYPLAWPG
jgi:hypothetical protein